MIANSYHFLEVNFRTATVLAGLMVALCSTVLVATAGAGEQSQRYLQVSQRLRIASGQPERGDILQSISSRSPVDKFRERSGWQQDRHLRMCADNDANGLVAAV